MNWEVRTMRSGTSFFNGTVWKKTFLRFWPIWASYLALWTMCLPLRGLMALREDSISGGQELAEFALGLGEFGGGFSVIAALCFGIMMAMAVCSHLYSSRSANFSGALPACGSLEFNTISGDVNWAGDTAEIRGRTTSGDAELTGMLGVSRMEWVGVWAWGEA